MTDYRASTGRIAAAIALLLSAVLLGGHGYAAELAAQEPSQETTTDAQEPSQETTTTDAQEPSQETTTDAQEPAAQEPAAQEPAAQEPAAQEPAAQEPAAQEPGYPDCTLEEIASPPTTGCVVNRGTADEALLWTSDEGSRYRLNVTTGHLLITYVDGSSILLDAAGTVLRTADASPAADSSAPADSLAATGVRGRLIGVPIGLAAAGGIVLAATAARRRL